MSDQTTSREEEANQQRKAEVDAERDEGVAITIGGIAEAIVKPLGQDQDDVEEARRQDVLNDTEQRPS